MFWRPDPRGAKVKQSGNAEWPRNGSFLTGEEFEHDGSRWLAVSRWVQAGSSEQVEAVGLFMPFEQGGLLLHKVEE